MDEVIGKVLDGSLGDYGNGLGPHYLALRDQLGRWSRNASRMHNLRAEQVNVPANGQLVSDFMELLPHPDAAATVSVWGDTAIHVPDTYTGRQVTAHVLWERSSKQPLETGHYPHYIIGSRDGGRVSRGLVFPNHPTQELLLATLQGGKLSMKTIFVFPSELEVAQAASRLHAMAEYPDSEVDRMFDKSCEEGGLLLDSRAPASIRFRFSERYDGYGHTPSAEIAATALQEALGLNPGDFVAPYGRNAQRRISARGIHAGPGSTVAKLTDEHIASFNIPHYLNSLAVVFNQVDTYAGLITAYSNSRMPLAEDVIVQGGEL